MKSLIKLIRNRLLSGLARQEDIRNLYHQIAGLQQIQNGMDGRAVLRPMRGWAISPDALAWVMASVQEHDKPIVVEFGSGQSTIALAAALKHQGGSLISVEHDSDYLAVIQKQIAGCGLSGVVQFVAAPLIKGADDILSYDVALIPDRDVSIVLIDGPPITIAGPRTRLVPLRWALTRLVRGGSVFLDDSNRPSEQACLRDLKFEFPRLEILERPAEKGLVELRLE